MPVRTVADWGGVHEWTVDAAQALIRAGHTVAFVGSGDLFRKRAEAAGATFLDIDWDDWRAGADALSDLPQVQSTDLVFAHAPQARMVALRLSESRARETFVMVHGAYHDHMYSWSHRVDGFLAASPSLVHFTQRFGRVEPWKVSLVPNAAPDSAFELPIRTLEERVSIDGRGHIVTASRLASDKLPQVDVAIDVIAACCQARPDIEWQLDVYGDGPGRAEFERRYRLSLRSMPRAAVAFHGWITPEDVPHVMNRAVVGVAAGMGAVRTIASGTLCVGVGARGSVGVQLGQNLRAGIWSNFGDHGTMRFAPSSVRDDLVRILGDDEYEETVLTAREILRRTNSQSVVDGMMLSALQC